MKSLAEKICILYPDLKLTDFIPMNNIIVVRNDGDGKGDYIDVWNHPTYSKPTQQQLDEIQ